MMIFVLQKFSYSLLSEGETSAGIKRGGALIDITITDNLLCQKMQVEIYTESVMQQQQQANCFLPEKSLHKLFCKATM
jgi:hypothetical protein